MQGSGTFAVEAMLAQVSARAGVRVCGGVGVEVRVRVRVGVRVRVKVRVNL